jgi:hypothetical protein
MNAKTLIYEETGSKLGSNWVFWGPSNGSGLGPGRRTSTQPSVGLGFGSEPVTQLGLCGSLPRRVRVRVRVGELGP